MQDLYHKLWDKQLPVIQKIAVPIALPQFGFRAGYKINLRKAGAKIFPSMELASNKVEQVFEVLQLETELPCGSDQLLVREEYRTMEHILLAAESEKWLNVKPKTGAPALSAKLDYILAGQPGSGMWYFWNYFSNFSTD